MKNTLFCFLKKGKPYIASWVRKLPYSHAVLGIPTKRILLKETDQYFRDQLSEKAFFKTFKVDTLQLNSPQFLNTNSYNKPKTRFYTCDNFIMSLPEAKYCHIHISVLTAEGFQLAMVSNHPDVLENEHALFHKFYLPKVRSFKGVGLLLSTPNDNNYFHCLFQIAPKIWGLKMNRYDVSQVDYFLLELSENSFQNEILSELGIEKGRIINLKVNKYVKVQQLLVTPNYSRPEPWICNKLRETFLTPKGEKDTLPKRIYISRNNASYRKLLNETEVIDLIKNFGFKVLCTEGMSIREQAQIFNNAEAIVTPHGAALANIVFCEPQTKVIEFRARSHNSGLGEVYEHLSSVCGLDHYTYLCDEKENVKGCMPRFYDIIVNIKDVEKHLSHIFIESCV